MATTTSSTKLNASITQNYRLTTDGTERAAATQFILLRRHIVDPTKSPAYKPPADGSAPPPVREEWREAGYYSLNSDGLRAAVQAAILRDTDVSQAETIAEALQLYAGETARIRRAIDGALSADFSDDLDALDGR